MTTSLVGYRLRRIDNDSIVMSWGGLWGQCPGLPALITVLPVRENPPGNFDPAPIEEAVQVCAPALGVNYEGYVLEEWMMEEPLPPIVPVTRKQFFEQAAFAGFITQAEALAAVRTGTVPAAMQTVIDGLPTADDRFVAEMAIAGAEMFHRDHDLIAGISAQLNLQPTDVDDFFRAAAQR